MKKIIALLLLSACSNGLNGRNGIDTKPCSVVTNPTGSIITCPDGSSTFVPNGSNGDSGSDGHSVIFNVNSATVLQCSNGGSSVLMATDLNDNNSVDVNDSNIQSVVLCNGLQGSPGQNAPPTPFTPVGKINPCGDAPNVYDEIFLKLYDGTVLASFSENVSGKNTRWVELTNGSYVTTDGDNCIFTIINGIITSENHHY